ncbi:tetratricopeptide repeat protein [Anaerovibrio lipolyticus]|uniref:tetratricopeptide repeat protein n=1 Tax=Anaerovibrio lipolyticus TaxID=82374 RepID=UPI0004801579|nr:tetratricopeptide repeat protein [Anaerovibrio lipolyticus]
MGSFKNKIGNKKKKKQANVEVSELINLKKKMKEQYSAGEYVEAMDTMAEIAKHKKMDPEIMAMGASCYFMTGDYERAAKWVNNTLTYDPNNISARLLLGRLCFVEDKPEDGFNILSFVVEKLQPGMKDEDKERLLDMLVYCHDNLGDMMAKYPVLEDYFKEHYVATASPTVSEQSSSIQDMLEASLSPVDDTPVNSDRAQAGDGQSKAQAAVARLKELLNKSKGNRQENKLEEKVEADEREMSPQDEEIEAVSKNAEKMTEAAEALINKVMSSNISFSDKIKGLNNFASGLYLNDDYDGAIKLLNKALEIDAHDPVVLKNMAFTYLAMGDKNKALEYASAIPMVEFGLIRAIKGHRHG